MNRFDETINAVKATLNDLEKLREKTRGLSFFFGFDGYIDSLYRMVKARYGPNDVEFFDYITEFGQRIIEIAGSSGSIERILKKRLGGGFTMNTGRAVANMASESNVTICGTLGWPEIDNVFKDMPANVKLMTIGQPGLTFAMEFMDGKIMSQDMEGINNLSWDLLIERLGGREVLIEEFTKANAIGNGHWSLMPYMTDYWKHFIEEIFPNVDNLKQKLFFVDPADLRKRSNKDIRDMLKTLEKINEYVPVILSVNDREAIDIARVLSVEGVPPIEKHRIESYFQAGEHINNVINLHYFVIHDPHFATISGIGEKDPFHVWITEAYTATPSFTTGAGDHFNGAAIMAILSGLTPEEALVVGNAATAIFVRTGTSPTIDALKKFIMDYFKYVNEDITVFEFPQNE